MEKRYQIVRWDDPSDRYMVDALSVDMAMETFADMSSGEVVSILDFKAGCAFTVVTENRYDHFYCLEF